MRRTRLDARELRALSFVHRTRNSIEQQLFVTNDGRERRAQLVRHHCQELALRAAGGFSLLARAAQLLLRPVLLRHIQEDRDARIHLAIGITNRRAVDADAATLPVWSLDLEAFVDDGITTTDRARERPLARRQQCAIFPERLHGERPFCWRFRN